MSNFVKHTLVAIFVVCFGFSLHSVSNLQAGDWPQILGPLRNGTAPDEELTSGWPKAGPKTLWEHKIGSGYAGPAVARSSVIVFHRVGGTDRLESLNASTGKRRWVQDFDATYTGGVNPDKGPRCVPLVHEANVFAFGAAGTLHCVDFDTGRVRWSRDLYGDYHGDLGYFGAGSSPIVMADDILVNVGGRNGAGLVALSVSDGTTRWKATESGASYSSPIQFADGANEYALFVTRLNAIVVDPTNGQVIDSIPFGKRGPTVNAASPLPVGDGYFLTASYGIGAALIRLTERKLDVVWQNIDVLSSQYNTPVSQGEYVFGIHGREDAGRAELRCIEAESGRVRWNETGFGVAHLILARDKIIALRVDGTLVLLKVSAQEYKPISSARIFDHETRALPALSNGRLFVRDNRRDKSKIRCFQVGRTRDSG